MIRNRRSIIATSQQLIQQECPTSTCSQAGSLVRVFPMLALEKDLTIPEELYSLNLPESSERNSLQLSCLKKLPDSYLMTASGRFKPSSVRFRNWGIVLNGWCITQPVSESRSQGEGCTLPDIAVPNAPEKYSLSNAAIAKLLSKL